MKALAAAIVFAMTAACSSTPPVPAATSIAIGGGDTLSIVGDWTLLEDASDGRRTNGQRLTRFGPALDQIWIATNVRPGQRIVEASADTFDGPALSGDDGGALVLYMHASINALQLGHLSENARRQVTFGQRSDFTLRTARGQVRTGTAYGRWRGERADIIIWIAESGVYAPRSQADVDAMFAQLQ